MCQATKVLHLAGLTAAAAVLLAMTTDVAAAPPGRSCGPRDTVVSRLAEGYGETRRSVGLATDQSMIEVFASSDTGSWTITVTEPGGLTCLVASGGAFEDLGYDLPLPGIEV